MQIKTIPAICFKNVWDSINRRGDETPFDELITRDRKNECFFYKLKPGMTFPTASELEKRERDREAFEKSLQETKAANKEAQNANIVAEGTAHKSIIAIIVSAVISTAAILWCHYHPNPAPTPIINNIITTQPKNKPIHPKNISEPTAKTKPQETETSNNKK